jgi:8-oxo-dGTP pyrophosphatase MutT (NUDIX family)
MPNEPKPSGTVVVLRDTGAALELLLLQRATREGKPGAWVFPGGKVEAPDRRAGDPPVLDALRAAVRETAEEAGLELEAGALVAISRWITPEISPQRFDTWFFLAQVDAGARVRIDGHEMCDHLWLAPHAALDAHHRHAIRLAPPTFVTVSWLAEFRAGAHALRELAAHEPIAFRPRIARTGNGACMLYPGDAGYDATDVGARGARHRLWALDDGWRYERSGG